MFFRKNFVKVFIPFTGVRYIDLWQYRYILSASSVFHKDRPDQSRGFSIYGLDNLAEDEIAVLALRVDKDLHVPIDSMASVKSQGIIGDKYIQLSLGGEEEVFKPGDALRETESSLDIESLISIFAFGSAE